MLTDAAEREAAAWARVHDALDGGTISDIRYAFDELRQTLHGDALAAAHTLGRADGLREAAGIAIAYEAEVGVSVRCAVCERDKKPRGRSAAAEMANSLCDHECGGYASAPTVGDLWPGERRTDFGFPRLADYIRAALPPVTP